MPKRFDNLYSQIIDFENLWYAYRAAAKGKRCKDAVARFSFHLEERLLELESELAARRYRPGPYRSFLIRDPKRRLISAAPFRDRVVHHALCRVIEPIFERTFIGDSYANRIGKGTHAALDRTQWFSRRYRYVLQCDLREFFPSIDHAILHAVLARKIACPDTLSLCDAIIDGGAGVLDAEYTQVLYPGDDLFATARPRGLPIGNLTSQFWANCLLNELDQFIKRELHCRGYVRYVDDFLLFADRKPILWAWKEAIRERLAALRLSLHQAESTVYPVTAGIPFLGFRVYPDRRRLKRRNGQLFGRRLRRRAAAYARGELGLRQIWDGVICWQGHAAHGNTGALRAAMLAPVVIPPRRWSSTSAAPSRITSVPAWASGLLERHGLVVPINSDGPTPTRNLEPPHG
jgi:RNA-directed DNA polymerase